MGGTCAPMMGGTRRGAVNDVEGITADEREKLSAGAAERVKLPSAVAADGKVKLSAEERVKFSAGAAEERVKLSSATGDGRVKLVVSGTATVAADFFEPPFRF